MTTGPTSPRDRFLRMMAIVLLAAGLVWLVLALPVRRGGTVDWTGVAVFLIVLAAFFIASGQSGRSSE